MMKLVMNISPTDFFRAIGDDTRWRIVQLVMEQALCVCELADILEMPKSTISSHVQIIRKAGLIESERCGKWTYFRIHPIHFALIKQIQETFSAHAECLTDRKKAEQRLLERESSCCPRPIHLSLKLCNLAN